VAHPVVVGLLKGKQGLVYQHGEWGAPPESLVRGDHLVLVPDGTVADTFAEAGFARDNLFVSGLCIEPALVARADACFHPRIKRLQGAEPLTGAFYSSGAEPGAHVNALAPAAVSAVHAGHAVVLYARKGGRYAAALRALFDRAACDLTEVLPGTEASPSARAILCLYESRPELDAMTKDLFPRFDFFVSPAHERTHWALGLGLPMFVVDPPIGTFAPLNRALLLDRGVAIPLAEGQAAAGFGDQLAELRRSGELERTAGVGWGRFDRHGFRHIAEYLAAVAEE
jgi:hypothetical protein